MKKFFKSPVLICIASAAAILLLNTAPVAAVTAVGVNDLKIRSGDIEIDFLKDTTASISEKFAGGKWGEDGSYTWANGIAKFDKGGNLVQLALMNNFTTSRGVAADVPAAKLFSAYPGGSVIEKTDDGNIYIYRFKIKETAYILGYAVSGKNNKLQIAIMEKGGFFKEKAGAEGDRPPLKHPISYYDGFTWRGADKTEKLNVCRAIAIEFKKAGYPKFMEKDGDQKLSDVLTKFYDDNTGNHGEFQKGPVDVVIIEFNITNRTVIQKVKQQIQ